MEQPSKSYGCLVNKRLNLGWDKTEGARVGTERLSSLKFQSILAGGAGQRFTVPPSHALTWSTR